MRYGRHNHRKAALFTSAVLATALFAGGASARGGHHHKGHHHGGWLMKAPIEKVAEQLELTEEQVQQIEAIREEAKAEREALKDDHQEKREAMKALWTAEVLDREAILAQFDQAHEEMGAIKRAQLERRIKLMSILTPAQRASAQEMKGHRGKRGKRGRSE